VSPRETASPGFTLRDTTTAGDGARTIYFDRIGYAIMNTQRAIRLVPAGDAFFERPERLDIQAQRTPVDINAIELTAMAKHP
jgi:hypothetical protein